MATKRPSMDEPRPSEDKRDRTQARLACAECRRSKLKCDKVFPCQSCVRRGCAAICPDGMQAATKGNKILQAQTERLSDKVKEQAARIMQLERELAKSKKRQTGVQGVETECQVIDHLSNVNKLSENLGSLAIGSAGQTSYHGATASSEMYHDLLDNEHFEHKASGSSFFNYIGLPPDLVELAVAFPFGLEGSTVPQSRFIPFIPPQDRALDLIDSFYQNSAYLLEPIPRADMIKFIVNPIYGRDGQIDVEATHAHELALLFCILAFGSLCKAGFEPNMQVDQYCTLSRAAVSLRSIGEETTAATVQFFFLINRLIFLRDRGRKCNEHRWLLTGICARLAQSMGLHRDCAAWGLKEEEVQRRRILFWEFYAHDTWTSIHSGRPPSLHIEHTDCRFPEDSAAHVLPSGEREMSFHAWKYRFAAGVLASTVKFMFGTRTPTYADVIELDKRIRQIAIPTHLQSPGYNSSNVNREWSADALQASSQYVVLTTIEQNLLLIHRSWFVQAIRQAPANPLEHQYGASVLAVVRSALKLITNLKGLCAVHLDRVRGAWLFWSGVYSACIALGTLVLECPTAPFARNIFSELDLAIPFYGEGSRMCRPSTTMASLHRLQRRAREALENNRPRPRGKDEPDEIDILGGQRSLVSSSSSSKDAETPAVDLFNFGDLPAFPPVFPADFSGDAEGSQPLHSVVHTRMDFDLGSTGGVPEERQQWMPANWHVAGQGMIDASMFSSPMDTGYNHATGSDSQWATQGQNQNQNDVWGSVMEALQMDFGQTGRAI